MKPLRVILLTLLFIFPLHGVLAEDTIAVAEGNPVAITDEVTSSTNIDNETLDLGEIISEFCKSMGINTTEKEIVSFIKSKKSELSEAELNAVNGGCNSSSSEQFCNALVSVGTVGTVCALSSIVKPTIEATEGNWGASCLD